MSAVENGVITQTSVSQVETFDHAQKGGCNLKWWFERVHFQRPDQSAAAAAGDAGHKLFALYFKTGKLPDGRALMKKALSYAILKGNLPKPGSDLLVEWRGDGQEKFSTTTCECGHALAAHVPGCAFIERDGCTCEAPKPAWVPLNKEKTLKLGGVPWELFADLAYRRDEYPTVMDHKFSTDPQEIAKPPGGLIKTVQMPTYVLGLRNAGYWRDATHWRIVHNYNRRTAGLQFFREEIVSLDQVLERGEQIAGLVEQMKGVATIADQRDVPFNRKSCDTWMGCPHQSICSAFKENRVNLDAREAELFGLTNTPAPSSPPPEIDEEATLKAEFDAKMAKIAADKKAKADAEAKAKADAAAKAEAEAKAKSNCRIVDSTPPVTGVLPDDAPKSDPAQASEQPKPDGKKSAKKADGKTGKLLLQIGDATYEIGSLTLAQVK